MPSLSSSSLFFLIPARHRDGNQRKNQQLTRHSQRIPTTRGMMMGFLQPSAHLLTCLCISRCLHCNPHVTHQSGIYAVEMTASFLLIWKASHHLYVPQYPQKRFSAVGCLEVKLHEQGERAERHFLFCLLSGNKFFPHFSIFPC